LWDALPTPSPRQKILPARGYHADLLAGLPDLADGEICYAIDKESYYQVTKNCGVNTLVQVGASKADLLALEQILQDMIDQGLGSIPDATELIKGIAKISTAVMAKERTDDSTIMSPLKVQKAIELLDGGDF
jgi:hypothetical protein